MALNLLKKYAELLEIAYMNPSARTLSLKGIFGRDIENNSNFLFRLKVIRPIVKEGKDSMETLFQHLTHEEEEIEEPDGLKYKRRTNFDLHRSQRLHWIKHHIEENRKENIEIFSAIERNQKKRKDVIKTYIYDIEQDYVIIMEPQKSNQDYYLLTAYYFNRPEGKKNILRKLKNKLPDIY